MDPGQSLKSLLQLQLATDSTAVIHLAYCLQVLDKSCLQPNPHLTKWSARIGSLLHSKDSGGRWAGLCLAHRSSLLSQEFMVDSASSWLPIALPMLSRKENLPTTKAAIRLLVTIFTGALEMPEFQRQISIPNVQKFTQALSTIATSSTDIELKSTCLETLAQIIPLYPNAHRQSFAGMTSLALGFLNGSHPCPTDSRILRSAAYLYATLHLTGGKVGAAAIWRKSMDDTIAFGWNAYHALRTTFPTNGPGTPPADPSISVPLNLDRLRCCSTIVTALLRTLTTRPVQVSCGQLVKFALSLISSSVDEKIEGFVDPQTRAFEVAAVPEIWQHGCDILASLAETIPQHLNPYISRAFTVLTYHLEQPSTTLPQKVCLLDTLQKILNACQPVDAPILPNRMVKAVLPFITAILDSKAASAPEAEPTGGKSSKKRGRNYEGDEVFKVSRDVICPSELEGKLYLCTLEVLRHCLKNPNLSVPQMSLASRVLLAIQLSMTQMAQATFAKDPKWFDQINAKVQSICVELASSSTVALHKATPLIIASLLETASTQSLPSLDILLHPRLPPVVRPMPSIQSISLFAAEESQEEVEARQKLRLGSAPEEVALAPAEDAAMEDRQAPAPAPFAPFSMNRPLAVAQQTNTLQRTEAPLAHIAAPVAATTQARPMEVADPPQFIQAAPIVPKISQDVPKAFTPQTTIISTNADEQDEEMPSIDMDSDSEDE